MTLRPVLLVPLLVLAGCASAPPPLPSSATPVSGAGMPRVANATVALAPASGSLVSGRLQAVAMGDGLHLTGDIGGLPRGTAHGLHVHAVGDCSAADAASAGPHFNPAGRAHGDPRQSTHHAGDLPNIVAGADGVAHVDVHVMGLTLGGAPATDIVGRALVVHAQGDDYTSQPAGNSGARIACGVVRAGG